MVIRNLGRSARAKVKLSFKALAYHREQRAAGHRDWAGTPGALDA
jgi:hypothetical protein